MNDRENQTSSDNTTLRYRALCNGIWGKAGTVFEPVKPGGIFGDASVTHFYAVNGGALPIISIGQLMDSPDFELVEEYWEPEEAKGYYTIMSNTCADTDKGLKFTAQAFTRTFGDDYYLNHNHLNQVFRTEEDTQACLDEVKELIQKRSKESRRLDNA